MRDNLETRTLDVDVTSVGLREFFARVYGWMALGLSITGIVAWMTYGQIVSTIEATGRAPSWLRSETMIVLILIELAFVYGISKSIMKIPPMVAGALFLLYSAINGVTMFFIFLTYTKSSITSTFLVTAGTFAGMSIYGMTTKRDLTGIGSMAMMAVWGLILASIVNLFMQNPMLYWVITYAGVLVFVALTAYDTQKLKAMYLTGVDGERGHGGLVIYGALDLYIDFINLFLYLLRLMGSRRSN